MQVNPVSALGRSNLKRRRSAEDEPGTDRALAPARSTLPAVTWVEPSSEPERIPSRYRPNAAFLAHLIATRDHHPQTRLRRQTEPQTGTGAYRAVAALPRQRVAGQVISTFR